MKDFLDFASKKYHEGNPVISDAEFDRLAELHNYENVGAEVGRHGIPHYFPMYSLKKCYVGEKQIALNGETIETPKLDGAAISVLYIGGKLVMGLTRGDGKRGEDITDKVKYLVPNELSITKTVQITGEVVAPKTIENARNYAAGALNLKDLSEFRTRQLIFIAYGIQESANKSGFYSTYRKDMFESMQMGFHTVLSQDWKEYPQDGKVYRLNNNKDFDDAGFTSSHPRGAFALKIRSEGIRTKLKGVVWQVGRTGAVSPVAELEPIKIGDALVSRATLHNIKYIRDLNLEIGCEVEVIRSGEIIPRVVRRVY
jgi:DNA ligase (NAD+)